jgi:hypothetical protein
MNGEKKEESTNNFSQSVKRSKLYSSSTVEQTHIIFFYIVQSKPLLRHAPCTHLSASLAALALAVVVVAAVGECLRCGASGPLARTTLVGFGAAHDPRRIAHYPLLVVVQVPQPLFRLYTIRFGAVRCGAVRCGSVRFVSLSSSELLSFFHGFQTTMTTAMTSD